MSAMTSWFRGHRTLASVVTLSLIVGVPITFAAINPGYPVTDVQLSARDVWVTKSSAELAGRMNTQVGQLDASVATLSSNFDVLQDGETILLDDPTNDVLRQVDSNKVLTSAALKTDLPEGATAKLDGDVLAIESGAGKVWRVAVSDTNNLNFDYKSTPSVAIPKLAASAKMSVERDGTVDIATTSGKLYQLDASTGSVRTLAIPRLSGSFQLSSVGTEPVILDLAKHRIIEGNGSTHPVSSAVSIQQPGDDASYALLSSNTGLIRVTLATGSIEKVEVPGAAPGSSSAQPVHMDNCDNEVWSATATAVYSCGTSKKVFKLGSSLSGDSFTYRVNQLSVALNDLTTGYAWLTDSAKLINDWESVQPQQTSPKNGKNNGKDVTFVVTPPHFDAVNQPPTAVDDSIGVRSEGTTPLPVLANDTDPDGDVLAVTTIGQVPASFGRVQLGGGGQSPQFTPAPGATGSQDVTYAISDGRGGTARATARITVVPDSVDHAPVANISASEIVEQGQTVTYNVLDDWADPDGDAMQLVGATAASGDDVRFTPDGYITFRSVSGLGVKDISYSVEDSAQTPRIAHGTLTVDVKAAGTTSPIAESDYASGFTGQAITISPLINDKSPSGQPLHLQTVKQVVGKGPAPTLNVDKGTLQVDENQAGSYEFEYTETAGTGSKPVPAFIRVDVANPPSGHVSPIAVSDTAYLRYPGSVTVPVLDNDVSPQDLVLGVQSISVPTISGFTAQLQSNTSIKISSTGTSAGNRPVFVTYTISDGVSTATATITVVAVAQLLTHQAPITTDDLVTVRAGSVATASVLDNDVDPDGADMSVQQKLVQSPSSGLAFVTGNDVRFQAPSTPGQYAVVYSVVDTGAQTSTGRVIFTVTAAHKKGNRAPQPVPVISRVFAGGTVRVQIPLAGIDPDGDTALLEQISQNPQLGRITNVTSTYFDYQAAKGAAGTDVFSYEVTDQYGATSSAPVRIGVIPRAGLALPTAVDDNAGLRPGRHATVNVLANDSDPNGYAIAIVPGSLKNVGTKHISAVIDGNTVVLHAGAAVGSYSVRYTISDGHAAKVSAIIHVTVSKTAVNLPPVAIDHVLQLKDVASGKPVKVAAREGASDPSGLIPALTVALIGKKSASARAAGGTVTVKPGKKSLTIAYTLTDPLTHLRSTAFILVPAIPPAGWNLAPYLNKKLGQQVVQIDTPAKFALSDLVTLPSHKGPAKIIGKQNLRATHGTVKYTDSGHFTFTPAAGYAGPASITFEVSDAASPAHHALLTLPVTVQDKNGSDLRPTFTTINTSAAQHDTTRINLLNATGNSTYVTWTVTGATQGVTLSSAGTRGSLLDVKVPDTAKEGAVLTLHVTLTTPAPSSYSVKGLVLVKIVSTRAPLAQAITDTSFIKRNGNATINALANDVNPTPERALRIVSVKADNLNGGQEPTTDGKTVHYTPPAGFVGSVSLHYTIEDATSDKDREVTGEILVTVWDVPDAPAAPTISGYGDGSVTIRFNTPVSDNGAPVTGYTVRSSPASAAPTCTAGADCTFTGLTNGTSYVFYVSATNRVGTSAESSASASVTPYRAPSAPQGPTATESGNSPSGTVSMSWGAPADSGGGDITYHWALSSGQTGSTTGTSASVGGLPAGNYSFTVYASNPAGNSAQPGPGSNSVNVPTPPPTTWDLTTPSGSAGDSCPQDQFTTSNFHNPSGCSATYSWVPGGTTVTAYCYVTKPGWQYDNNDIWYLFSGRGTSGTYPKSTWYINGGTVSGSTSGMPGC